MSECITRVEKIIKIEAHPNADLLEVAHVKGWHCVVRKGVYKDGDLCVYIPIDSVLPEALSNVLFEGTKVKPPSRIKTIRLRGLYSQGLVCSVEDIKNYVGLKGFFKEDQDLTELLGITKYEPHVPGFQSFNGGKKSTAKNPNPLFRAYKGFENFKNYNDLFDPEDNIIATEKIHGTNFRAGWVPREKPTNIFLLVWYFLMSKIKKDYEWEWLAGSHNVQRDPKDNNLYSNMARKLNLKDTLVKGEQIFGEIFGPSIQKGYHYGMVDDEVDFVAFDLMKDGVWRDFDYMNLRFQEMGVNIPPVLFRGKFKELNIDEMVLGDSIYSPAQKIREGIVLRTETETFCPFLKGHRKMLKCVSPEYLLKDNTDFH